MLTKLRIKNYKSIADLELELGRINVFIGENGCGKTNLLEAVGMLAGADSGKLELDELYGRGIRIAKPSLTVSAFSGHRKQEAFEVYAEFDAPVCNFSYRFHAEDLEDINSPWKTSIQETFSRFKEIEKGEISPSISQYELDKKTKKLVLKLAAALGSQDDPGLEVELLKEVWVKLATEWADWCRQGRSWR